MSRKTRYLLYGIAFIAAFVVSAGLFGSLLAPKDSVLSPHIIPAGGQAPILVSTHTFPFEQSEITITVPVNSSVYRGAQTADKSVTIYGNVSENIWMADSYRAMVNDPAQDEFYQDLTGELRKVKDRQNLSDDEYLELMSTFVQSLRYETIKENPAKFPIETVMDGAGDCDDKSLLLAGLLSHEGYNVALLSFGPEGHMATGVGSTDYLYKNSSYAFVETTNVSFVGVPTTTLNGGIPLVSDPIVIPIGNGTKIYQEGKTTRYISDTYNLTGGKADEMEPQVKALAQGLEREHSAIGELEDRMTGIKNSGNIQGYNAQVQAHNSLVAEYNAGLASYRSVFAKYQKYVDVHNYILLHAFDRKGVYEYVKANLPA